MTYESAVDLVTSKLHDWLRLAIASLPNLVLALLVVVLFGLAARAVRAVAERGLRRVTDNRGVVNLLATVLWGAVLAAGVFVALGILDLDKTVTSLLAGAGIVGLALAFAFQDAAENLVSGIAMSVRRPFHVGDLVETNGFFGTVEDLSLRNTVLRKPDGPVVLIPNKDVFQKPLVNFSRLGRRRIDLEVGVSYGDDLERARAVAIAAVEEVHGVEEGTPVEVFYTGFGASSIDFTARFWIDTTRQKDWLAARSEAIVRIKAAFDREGITIPFPIRTLDFGIVGGVPLREALPVDRAS